MDINDINILKQDLIIEINKLAHNLNFLLRFQMTTLNRE